MSVLLVDNSNSRTKFALADGGGEEFAGEIRWLPTSKLSPERIDLLLSGWRYEEVWVASVVPGCRPAFYRRWGAGVRYVAPAMLGDILSEYPGAASLGADRVANIAAVVAHGGPFPCVVIDAGTAVTFDLVVRKGAGALLAGGIIAPGLRTMARALWSSAAQLPEVDFSSATALEVGCNTETSLRAGVLCAFAGMLREATGRMRLLLGSSPHLLATGGDAALAQELFPDIDEVDDRFTFRGLRYLAMRG